MVNGEGPAGVFGLGESHKGHIAAALSTGRAVLLVAPNEVAAVKLHDDIACYDIPCAHFPTREIPLSGKGFAARDSIEERRVAVLSALAAGKTMTVVTCIQALMQRIVAPEIIKNSLHSYEEGQTIEPRDMVSELVMAGYERVDVCEAPGQVCLRGGYVDVYPIAAENPARIEFFGDEIDTLRIYDPLTQRSVDNVDHIDVPPATEMPITDEARARALKLLKKRKAEELASALEEGGRPDNSVALLPLFYPGETTLFDYIDKDWIILIDEPARLEESGKIAYQEFLEGVSSLMQAGEIQPEQANLTVSPLETIKRMDTRRTAMMFALTRSYGLIGQRCIFRFDTRPVSRYVGREELLAEDIEAWKKSNTSVLIYAGTHAKRLQDRLLDSNHIVPIKEKLDRDIVPGEVLIIEQQLNHGFEYPELSLAVVTENELYGTENRRPADNKKKRRKPQLVFSELNVGDLVVHELHGIGRFVGVETLTVGGVQKDYLHLVYSGGDKLYIPTDQLDRVQKYIGGGDDEGTQRLSKLGSGEWQKTVSRTRDSVKKLAFDLVRLYGERQKRKGFKFSPDTPWQRKLEDSFPYEPTPDQLTSIQEIKADMESDKVMDRLLCGDVGYGKTEVALRAVMKCVLDGKQAAILVPTTVLAQQHYATALNRFRSFPVRIEVLSRFKTPAQKKQIMQDAAAGKIDLLIGTHSLLQKSLHFKDLGLLIIDEEQRFGVTHKEKLKELSRQVDTLTLSATPIPRTLNMALSGIRDMSTIEVPPVDRQPVQTYVLEHNWGVIADAIRRELARGGQVYYMHNRVETIDRCAAQLRKLLGEEVSIGVAHGKMDEKGLSSVMQQLSDGEIQVLVCTTIIETGIDIPNVNTLIIEDADHLGLAQLHQIRGRIGRSARRAYAYMTYRAGKILTEVAAKRLTAIREYAEFGSGFRIAMRDLEIRGAGNLLGPEQSGYMMSVGYDMYLQLLEEAVLEQRGEKAPQRTECSADLTVSANLPESYISSGEQRMDIYRRIAALRTAEQSQELLDELIDRYGEPPPPVLRLMDVALLRAEAMQIGVCDIAQRGSEISFTFAGADAVPVNAVMALCSLPKNRRRLTLSATGTEPKLLLRLTPNEDALDTALTLVGDLRVNKEENEKEVTL